MNKLIVVVSLAFAGVACTSPSDDGKNDREKETGHVWQDQVGTLDKARDVEQTLTDAQKQRDRILRQQE